MFCYQCEQTAKGTGCKAGGVCGKDAETSELQDLLVYALKGLGQYAHRLRGLGESDPEINVFTLEGMFSTLTNVNFDPARVDGLILRAVELRNRARDRYLALAKGKGVEAESPGGPGAFVPATDRPGRRAQAAAVGIESRRLTLGPDVTGLQELVLYGLKGVCAYGDHAQILGQRDEAVYAFIHEALDFLTRPNPTVDELLGYALRTGEINLKVMELLDRANTGIYGHPAPTPVRIAPRRGKAIVVSGHDLKDLEELLKQTAGTGINVYTHGEMLPAHGYPGLKKYPHLAGNYGGAWQDQRKEFDAFPGAILMTTNCIQRPKESYQARIFTSGLVAWPGARHIADRNFAPVIAAAQAAPGFAEDGPDETITVGFGHEAVLGVAGKVVDLVKQGKIKHFFLIGGCDGAKTGRNYYTEFAQKTPADTIMLTLACGKYRFNKLSFGSIEGIPRLLDVGQCNDAYSAIQIALALAGAFKTDVNSLPLSMVLSWYEQKAVAILLTLLFLGIKNIRLGPSLPAFVTPAALEVLVKNYAIKPISTPDEDLKAILG